MIDFLALKMGLETFEEDAVDACYQAPEHEEVVVEPAPEYFERLAKAGRDTDIAWRLPRQRSELGGTRGRNSCEQVGFFYWSAVRLVALELQMDDFHARLNSSEVTDVKWGTF